MVELTLMVNLVSTVAFVSMVDLVEWLNFLLNLLVMPNMVAKPSCHGSRDSHTWLSCLT